MLRLRTTAALSALALLVGVAGTGALSSLTEHWRQPSDRVAMVGPVRAAASRTPKAPRWHGPVTVVQPTRAVRRTARRGSPVVATADAATAPVALQPLATPAIQDRRWSEWRDHRDGHLVVHLRIDGQGRVEHARVAVSSGDPILDQHALRSVRGWRFAVPANHPAGLSGDLPMRFSSQERELGML